MMRENELDSVHDAIDSLLITVLHDTTFRDTGDNRKIVAAREALMDAVETEIANAVAVARDAMEDEMCDEIRERIFTHRANTLACIKEAIERIDAEQIDFER